MRVLIRRSYVGVEVVDCFLFLLFLFCWHICLVEALGSLWSRKGFLRLILEAGLDTEGFGLALQWTRPSLVFLRGWVNHCHLIDRNVLYRDVLTNDWLRLRSVLYCESILSLFRYRNFYIRPHTVRTFRVKIDSGAYVVQVAGQVLRRGINLRTFSINFLRIDMLELRWFEVNASLILVARATALRKIYWLPLKTLARTLYAFILGFKVKWVLFVNRKTNFVKLLYQTEDSGPLL